jgi:hypothetical protein
MLAASPKAGDPLADFQRFDQAVVQWQEARGLLGILAGKAVVKLSDELLEAVKKAFEASKDAAVGDAPWKTAREIRARLTDEMRTELGKS